MTIYLPESECGPRRAGSIAPVWSRIVDAITLFAGETSNAIANRLSQYRRRRTDRLALETLLRLDDRMLGDIGVTRDDVAQVSKLPLSVDAAAELQRIKNSRLRGS